MARLRFLSLLTALLPTVALATNVSGTLPGDTTWSPLGNPYVLTGDLTVPPGVTLTLEPGVVVTFSGTDGLGSGTNIYETELIVDGTLLSQGTSAAPVSITATNAYGVRVQNGALAIFDATTLTGGIHTLTSHGITYVSSSTVKGGTTECVRVGGGTFDFTRGTLTGCFVALNALGGSTTVDSSLVTASGSSSISKEAVQISATTTLRRNTLTGNPFGAVRIFGFTGRATIVDNIISSNGTYGLNFDSNASPTQEVHHNLVWGQLGNAVGSSSNYSVTANPLFVGGTNYRITENSPARLAASDGTDLGAFPYAGDPTTPLQGTLFTSRTLTGAHPLAGDLTVRPGVTLTLAPGASLTFAASDASGSGTDTSKTELIVNGTLQSQGTVTSPVSITATNAYGVRVQSGATATLEYTTLSGGLFTLTSNGATTLTQSTVQGGTTECVRVGGGTFDFTRGMLTGCNMAVRALAGRANIQLSVVKGNGAMGPASEALQLLTPGSLVRNTITGNAAGGVYIGAFSGTVTVVDNIISSNGPRGLIFGSTSTSQPSRTVRNNLLWGHTTNSQNTGANVGTVTGNPLFVGGTNYRITENSPARLAATDGTDLGAFPYAGDPTTSLLGILYTDKTLSGANTLAGDLTVRPGVTLTLAAGASLTFAATDAFGTGAQKTELIINGTLLSQGTRAAPVTINATGASGVRVLSGATATLDYTTLTGGDFTLENTGNTTLTRSTVQNATTTCLRTGAGTLDFSRGTLSGCPTALSAFGGTTSLTYSLVKASGSSSRFEHAIKLSAPTSLVHNTITGSSYGAVYVYAFSPGTVSIFDNIITATSGTGLSFSNATSPTRDVHHNDVWGHATNYVNVAAGAGSVSVNPLFVSTTDYSLQQTSPCRNLASDGTDLGAFPYAPPVPARVVVMPVVSSLPVQGSRQFTATAYDAASNVIPNRPVTWSASAAAGTISSTGLFTAGCTPGSFSGAVTAIIDGKAGTANVTLTAGSAAFVTLDPPSATVALNGSQQFTAVSWDACGNVLSGPVSWAVTSGDGTIDSTGLFTAGAAAGTSTVEALNGAVSATATVTVTDDTGGQASGPP